ncbi:hypothetical protein AVEN_182254-1 [Araneus ventricosus]|uniref:Uncharacterized protein n=1 Tax=Araneus ventricosus TaxID=182803 RepID=A0A4Y2H9T9_ARAVE|nr:hypothetical protein AVEN_182254-1 [Araneus ventricosus]
MRGKVDFIYAICELNYIVDGQKLLGYPGRLPLHAISCFQHLVSFQPTGGWRRLWICPLENRIGREEVKFFFLSVWLSLRRRICSSTLPMVGRSVTGL